MEIKPRKMWIAGTLAFFTIGLGHLYAGDIRKGVFLFLGQGLLTIIAISLLLTVPKSSIIINIFVIFLIYSLYNIIDAIILARRNSNKRYQLKIYNKLYIYILVLVVSNFIITPVCGSLIKRNFMASYKIPTGSMIPTILLGDQIISNQLIYKYSKPSYGDIVIFKPPHKDTNYIKRIIGVSGDVIEIKDKKLFVNNIKQKENYVAFSDNRIFPAYISRRDNCGPVTVPENSVFLLGDNRDNSEDSRFWGMVDLKNVHGKAQNVYWSWDKKNIKVRWGRVFQGINFADKNN